MQDSFGGAIIGTLAKDVDKMEGPFFLTGIKPFLGQFKVVNVAGPVAPIIGAKSDTEVLHLKGAAKLSSDVMKKLKNLVLDAVDEEDANVPHESLADKVCLILVNLEFLWPYCVLSG